MHIIRQNVQLLGIIYNKLLRGVGGLSKSDFSRISTDFLLYILLIILPFCILLTSTTFYFHLFFRSVNIFLNRKNQMYHAVSTIMTMRYSTT